MPKIAFALTPTKFVYEFECFQCLKEWLAPLEPKELDAFKYCWYRCPICMGEMDKWYQSITR